MELSKASSMFIQNLIDIGLSHHTIRSYKTDLSQLADIIGADSNLDKLTYPDISKFFSHLQDRSLATASLRRKRAVVKRFFSFTYDKGLCTNDISKFIDPIRAKKNNKPKEILNSKEIVKIEKFFNNKIESFNTPISNNMKLEQFYIIYRNKLLVAILLYTGCRAQEAVSIKKSNVSLKQNSIEILTKGNKYNNIPIHSKLKTAFKEYYSEQEIFKELEHVGRNNIYLFPSKVNKDKHISTRTLYDLMLELSNLLDRNIHAHLFRHTFASYAIASGINVGALSSMISHSSPAITLSIYTHEIEERQKQEEIKKLHFDF